jgi:hypothetical protein
MERQRSLVFRMEGEMRSLEVEDMTQGMIDETLVLVVAMVEIMMIGDVVIGVMISSSFKLDTDYHEWEGATVRMRKTC